MANAPDATIGQVVVSGSGFERALGDIPAGATATTTIHPRGGSGLALSFRSRGRHVALAPSGYFEGGGRYVVTVVVRPDLGADVDARLAY